MCCLLHKKGHKKECNWQNTVFVTVKSQICYLQNVPSFNIDGVHGLWNHIKSWWSKCMCKKSRKCAASVWLILRQSETAEFILDDTWIVKVVHHKTCIRIVEYIFIFLCLVNGLWKLKFFRTVTPCQWFKYVL